MEQKKNKKVLLAQLLLIVGFIICALGSASYDQTMSSDSGYYIKSAAEGLQEGSSGRTFIGKATSESDCYQKAKDKGCTGLYSYYEHDGNCYCN
jgi:hypothetical protein